MATEWLKANGGPAGLIVLGVLALFANVILGLILIVLGGILWLNAARWFPWKVVRESKLEMGITDVNFTQAAEGVGGVQVNAWVRNLGAQTILHSWELDFELSPGEPVAAKVLYDWQPVGM